MARKIISLFTILIFYCLTFKGAAQSLTYTERNSYGPLNPYADTYNRGISDRLFSMIYEPLFRYDHNIQEFREVLARNHSAFSQNRITIELRNDVRWHDGQRFTARDVEFTYRYIMEKSLNTVTRTYFAAVIESVRAVGDFSVEFTFSSDITNPLSYLNTWIIPAHLFNTETMDPIAPQLFFEPSGTGSFQFQNRSRSGDLSLAANRQHPVKEPEIREVSFTRTVDMDTAVQRLLNGQTDLMVEVFPERLAQIEANLTHRLEPYQSYSVTAIGFNMQHEALQNQRLRHAMVHATNRQNMLDAWFAGRGEVLAGPFSQAAQHYNPELTPFAFDRNLARNLLESAGYADRNGDGFVQGPDGNRLELSLLQRIVDDGGSPAMQNVSADFQRMMAEIGVQIRQVNRAQDDYVEAMYGGDFDLILVNLTFTPEYNITPIFTTGGTSNFISYNNADVDQLFSLYYETNDRLQRLQYMNRIQNIIAQEAPFIFLFSVDWHAAIHSRFARVLIDPLYFFSDIDQWQVLYE